MGGVMRGKSVCFRGVQIDDHGQRVRAHRCDAENADLSGLDHAAEAVRGVRPKLIRVAPDERAVIGHEPRPMRHKL